MTGRERKCKPWLEKQGPRYSTAEVHVFNSIITVEVGGGAALQILGQPGQHTEPQDNQDSTETPSKQKPKQTKKPDGTAVRKTHTAPIMSPVGSAFETTDAVMASPRGQIVTIMITVMISGKGSPERMS